jgi:hypothetical protein
VQNDRKHGKRAQTQSRVARDPIPLSERIGYSNHPPAEATNPANRLTKRAAYSPAEFAESCGKHPSWAYRLLYGGKIRALTDLGRILIPVSELERVLSSAAPYDPKPRKTKTHQSGKTIGGEQ